MYPLGCIYDENDHTRHHKMAACDLEIEVKVTNFLPNLENRPKKYTDWFQADWPYSVIVMVHTMQKS